jgi:hypothetical protein
MLLVRGKLTVVTKSKIMKQMLASLKYFLAMGLLTLAVGCATSKDKENSLVAAGFQVITPKTAAQEQKLKALLTNRVTMTKKDGKILYMYPDVAKNVAYVGGPKQYKAYRQIRIDQKMSDENLEAAEINEDESMEWNEWGGWGPWWGGQGWY